MYWSEQNFTGLRSRRTSVHREDWFKNYEFNINCKKKKNEFNIGC
jgi:hypothetical protein